MLYCPDVSHICVLCVNTEVRTPEIASLHSFFSTMHGSDACNIQQLFKPKFSVGFVGWLEAETKDTWAQNDNTNSEDSNFITN